MLINGNSLHIPLPAGSVHCIATSPPYFGLRDYGLGDAGIGMESLHDCLGWATGNSCTECYVWRRSSGDQSMYRKPRADIERYRYKGQDMMGSKRSDGNNGVFEITYNNKVMLSCIVSDELGWEHVSVTPKNHQGKTLMRCPTWEEMCFIKDCFWRPEETVMQLHPPASQYVNIHPHVLHLWRKIGTEIPLPPRSFV